MRKKGGTSNIQHRTRNPEILATLAALRAKWMVEMDSGPKVALADLGNTWAEGRNAVGIGSTTRDARTKSCAGVGCGLVDLYWCFC